jgi:transcriptional regulator with XRE-family HTH domain
MEGFGARLAARARALGLTNAEVARRAGLSERRFGNYATDTREPDLQTLVTLARVLATSTDQLLGVVPEKAGSQRDRLLGRIEASLTQIGDDQLELISVQIKAVADLSKQEKND